MARDLWGGRKFQAPADKAGMGATINHLVGIATTVIRRESGAEAIVLEAEVGDWRVKVGDHSAHTFDDTDVTTGTDEITMTAHGYVNGDGPLRLTDGGGLPAGLLINTDYWVIVVDANTIKLAASPGNANRIKQTGLGSATQPDPIPVDITTAGAAVTHTLGGTTGMIAVAADGTVNNGVLLDAADGRPGSQLIVSARVVTVVSFGATDALAYWFL